MKPIQCTKLHQEANELGLCDCTSASIRIGDRCAPLLDIALGTAMAVCAAMTVAVLVFLYCSRRHDGTAWLISINDVTMTLPIEEAAVQISSGWYKQLPAMVKPIQNTLRPFKIAADQAFWSGNQPMVVPIDLALKYAAEFMPMKRI